MPWKRLSFLISLLLFLAPSIQAATLEQIKEIRTAPASDLPELWKKYRKTDKFRFLVMQQWLKIAPEAFLNLTLSEDEVDQAWWLRGRLAAQAGRKATEVSSISDKLSGDQPAHNFLSGFASERPDEVAQLVQTEGEFRTSSATSAIILGWAKHSPEKAISLAEQSSPFDWKSATPTWTALDHVDWWHSSRSDTESFALSRWVAFRSKEALSDLFEQEDITLNYYYIGILAQKFPDEIKGMVNRLPTGTKKRKILAGIEYAKENPSEIQKFFSLASPEETLVLHKS